MDEKLLSKIDIVAKLAPPAGSLIIVSPAISMGWMFSLLVRSKRRYFAHISLGCVLLWLL